MILHEPSNSFTVDSNSKFDFLGCSVHVPHESPWCGVQAYLSVPRWSQCSNGSSLDWRNPKSSGARVGQSCREYFDVWNYVALSAWSPKEQNRELGEFNLFLIWFLVCNVMTSRFRGSNFIYLQSCFGKLCHSQHFLLPSLVLWESKSIEFCHSIGARAPTNKRTSWGNSSSTGAWVKSRNLFGTERMTSLSLGPQKADCFG